MNIHRQIAKIKRQIPHFQPFFLPAGIVITTVAVTITLLTLFSTPRAPRLRIGSGDTLYSASNKNFSTTVGKKDGTPAISFSRGESQVSFILAGAATSKPQKEGNAILFPDVLTSTDLKYTTTTNGLKEELIVKQYNKDASNIFLFDLSMNQVTPKNTTSNFIDPTFKNQAGSYLFHFEKPFAIDASGNRTDDVLLQIMEDKQLPGNYSMKLIVDENWLNSPTRTYPITIDPTIVHDTTAEFAAGTLNRVKDFGSGSSPMLESSYQPLVADEYTVGLWHMDEASGNALDASGNGNTGTPTGTTINTTTQKIGSAARTFNGTSDRISVANNSALNVSSFTFSAWVYINSFAARNTIYDGGGATNTPRFGTETTTGLLNLYKSGVVIICSSASAPPLSKWTHVAVTYDGNTCNIYIDGTLNKSTISSQTFSYTGVSRNIGATYGPSEFFNGSIDELQVSNIARTPEEIKASASRRSSAVYTSPVLDLGGASSFVTSWNNLTWNELGVGTGDGETLKDSTGLLAQWNFNETSGTTATNNAGSCGASCNGTLTGFASTASQDQSAGTGWTTNNRRWGAGALNFDGSNDYITLPNSLGYTTQVSAFTWFKSSGAPKGGYHIIFGGQELEISIPSTGELRTGVYTNARFVSNAGTGLTDGKWHYIGFTFDGSNKNSYIDGKLVGTQSITGTLTSSFANRTIGQFGTDTTYALNGALDSISIYSRALSAAEIMSNYGAGNIEIQTRVGGDASPDDGSWNDWSSTAVETQLASLDSDSSNWSTLPLPTSQSSCKEILDNGLSTGDGIYTIALDGQSFSVYCDMTTNGGGWTLVANIAPADGGSVGYNNQNFWTKQAEYGSFANKFANDYKSPAAYKLKGDQLMIQSTNTGAAGSVLGWRSWPMTTKRTFNSFFTHGIEAVHATDTCETGSSDAVSTGTSSTWDDILRQGTCLYSNVNPSASGEGDTIRLTTIPYNGTDNNMSGFASCIDCGTTWQGTTNPYQGIDRAACNSSSCTYATICRVPSADCLGAYCTNPTYSSTSCGSTWNSRFFVREKTLKTLSKADESNIKSEGTGSLKLTNNVLSNSSLIDSNTIGLWHLDETGGTGAYLKDSSATGNHATPNGTTTIDGVSSKARNFNGSGNYITANNPLSGNASRTISAWVKISSVSADPAGLVGWGTTTSTGQISYLTASIAGSYNFGFWGWSADLNSGVPSRDNKWHHLAFTYDGAIGTLYVDGISKASSPLSLNTQNSPLNIGRDNVTGYSTYPYGSIDEVKIDKIARTAEEIAESYRLGRDHYYNKTISSSDLSSKTSLPFYVAADRPGTYLSASVGESAFTNSQPDSNTVGLWHLDETTETARSCYSLRLAGVTTDGIYTIDPDGPGGNAAFQAYCNMTYDGGGWTMAVKSWYGSGMIGNVNAVGSVADATTLMGNAYKLSDTNVKNIIGPSNNFDVMADQNGYNSAYSTGNYEYVVLRNYTGVWSYASAVAASSTTTSMQSYRISDQALAWSGNMTCGVGGAGINCSALAVGNPQGGAGCIINMGTASNTGWHHFYMNETNDNTYLYMCNGPQHSSGFSMNHRWWVRERNPIPVIKSKDASNSHNEATNVGASSSKGILGSARSFNGTSDFISIANNSSININGTNSQLTLGMWIYPTNLTPTWQNILYKNTGGNDCSETSCSDRQYTIWLNNTGFIHTSSTSTNNIGVTANNLNSPANLITSNKWHHIVLVINSSNSIEQLYVNGTLVGTTSYSSTGIRSGSGNLFIGATNGQSNFFNGSIDEVRIDNVARTADEIRQAYEMGLRSHPITIDFAANLDSGNLISSGADLAFTVDATAYGLGSKGSMLFAGDKVIVRENYNGTEYIAQGTVDSINASTGSASVSAWDTSSTFPSGGYTSGASVFKWQREYMNIDGEVLDSSLDGITQLTLRLTDGLEGRTIYLDDLKSSGGYLTNPLGSSITSSTGDRYFQYRAILSSFDEAVSATLSALTLDYTINTAPSTPTLTAPIDGSTNASLLPLLQTSTTDPDSDYLRYKFELCTNVGMSVGCLTFDQTSTQTGWSGQNAQTSTAYTSGTQASYTLSSPLSPNTTYYYRSYGIDPAGTNTWSTTQGTPYSFTTTSAPSAPSAPYTEGATNPVGVTDSTPEFSAVHADVDGDPAVYYEVEVNTATDFTGTVMWDSTQTAMTSTANTLRSPDISYAGSSLSFATPYYWRIRFTDDQGATSSWSTTQSFTMNTPPATPTLTAPTNTATNVSLTPTLQTSATDVDSDYLRYKFELCTNAGMSAGCQTFDQTSSQTNWAGQNTEASSAYTSGATASYVLSSALSPATTYYYRSYAIDPSGTDTWSTTQGVPYSFTTENPLLEALECRVDESNDKTSFVVSWLDRSTTEDGYEIQRSVNGGSWAVLATGLAPNSSSYSDSSISSGTQYRYRIASYLNPGVDSATRWCTTSTLLPNTSTFKLN